MRHSLSPLSVIACFFLLSALTSCDDDEKAAPTERHFYMGTTPFPYEASETAVNYTYQKISESTDIINHHFDNGVPWVEALADEEFSAHIQNDWNLRKSKTPANHKVYVSVTPINLIRTGLASYHGETDNMELPAPWNSYAFDHEDVKTAYLNYCKRVIDFFEPDYFNIAIEANILRATTGEFEYLAYYELHKYIYTQLKLIYPSLTVFCSVSAQHLLPAYIGGPIYIESRQFLAQLLEYSDLYAISFYPYLSSFLGNPYPSNSFDELLKLSDKPFAIAEAGYPAQTFTMDMVWGTQTISGTREKQEFFIRDMLDAAIERENTQFVINFVMRDYDQLWVQIGSPTDINIAWRDTGLIDEAGTTRTSLDTWHEFYNLPYKSK